MRVTLEAEAIRLAVPRMTAEDLARLEGSIAEMAHFAEAKDYRRWIVPHQAFHRALTAPGGRALHRRPRPSCSTTPSATGACTSATARAPGRPRTTARSSTPARRATASAAGRRLAAPLRAHRVRADRAARPGARPGAAARHGRRRRALTSGRIRRAVRREERRHGRRATIGAGDALIAEMTPAEKAGQLTQYFYFRPAGERRRTRARRGLRRAAADGRGGARRAARSGSLLFVTDPAETNRLQRLAVEGNRLGIPALFGFDVIHGLRTILPVPIAMAASWDPETIERGQAVAAREARAVGIHWAFAPMVDIARDPRWGRIVEGAGEDPFLGAAVAAAQVRGFQGDAVGRPSASSPGRSTSPATARRSAGATTTRSTSPTPSCGTSTCRRSRRRVAAGAGQRDDRLHGPQRHPGDRQPLAVHRRAARRARASRASWSATPTRCATS